MGLLAALSWQFRHGCKQAGIKYTENFPASAPEMDAHRLITLFRIAQELFNLALQRESLSTLALAVTVKDGAIRLQMSMDGKQPGPAEGRQPVSVPTLSILHRVRQLKGDAAIASPPDGSDIFCVTIPVD